jgi:hypothetical protein
MTSAGAAVLRDLVINGNSDVPLIDPKRLSRAYVTIHSAASEMRGSGQLPLTFHSPRHRPNCENDGVHSLGLPTGVGDDVDQ